MYGIITLKKTDAEARWILMVNSIVSGPVCLTLASSSVQSLVLRPMVPTSNTRSVKLIATYGTSAANAMLETRLTVPDMICVSNGCRFRSQPDARVTSIVISSFR